MSIDGIGAVVGGGGYTPPPPTPVAPEFALTSMHNGQPVVVGASRRFGGAIYSIKVGGFEFLDSSDHGRELQTAWQLDGMGEAQNPTEAGSSANGSGATSSTQILSVSVNNPVLKTRVKPAYWYPYQNQVTSQDILEKTVTLGHSGRNNILVHDIGMYLAYPYHTGMAVEGLTAYMPQVFNRFFRIGGGTKVEIFPGSNLTTTIGPVMVANQDLSKALALVSSITAPQTYWIGRIGPWPKLDCSWFTATDPHGWYRWRCFTVFGTAQEVVDTVSSI